MNRIQPLDPTQATGSTKQLFDGIRSKLGMIPNALRVFGHSPAALQGYLDLSRDLAGGVLPPKLREQIALAVSEVNGCGYCLSAHSQFAKKAGLKPEEIQAARQASATDDKEDAALTFARAIALERGRIQDVDLDIVRTAGWTNAEVIEIAFQVALVTLTNYVNNVAEPAIEFPPVEPGVFPETVAGANSGRSPSAPSNQNSGALALKLMRVPLVAVAFALCASAAFAQTAREVRGPAGVVPLTGEEAPAKIVIDPPVAEWLAGGRVVIQYRTENLRIVQVFGLAALDVSPRIGHVHVTVDDLPWHWADASGEAIIITRLPVGPHRVLIELVNANHQTLDQGVVSFVIPKAM